MSDALDLEPIKARLAAASPGVWVWSDELRDIPYDTETYVYPDDGSRKCIEGGNDGTLGIEGLYRIEILSEESDTLHPLLVADDQTIPDDPDNFSEIDWSIWRGPIKVTNKADLAFIAQAKNDVGALLAEVERLRAQHPLDQSLQLARTLFVQLGQVHQAVGAPHGESNVGLLLWLLEGRIMLPAFSSGDVAS